MSRKKQIIKEILIEAIAAEGKSIGYHEGKVVFVNGAIPGDIVDILIKKNKSSFIEGIIIGYGTYSKDRIEAFF